MFKSWRNDKNKIKAVFKLQFQATQVPKLKKPALVITLVPEDAGKPTFKLEKAAVQDGTCTWETPIYVTVKLVREPKTGKLHEKLYHFIVSSGSSKSGYLGESSIDFADFAEEIEPLTVSLPLKFANSGAILHLTIQKVEGEFDGRFVEAYGNQTPARDGSLKNQLSNNGSSSEDSNLDLQNDGHDHNASFKELLRQDSTQKETVNSISRKDRKSSADWSIGSDGSLADLNSPEDRLPRELQEASSESTEQLKAEIASLTRQSELTELEVQSLRKQIMKENRRVQDLSRQVVGLREERDALSIECRELKSSQKRIDEGPSLNALRAENKKSRDQLEESKRELSHQKEVNNNLKLQLEKTQESNSELILAVRDLDEMMEQKNTEISRLSSKLDVMKALEQNCNCNKDVDEGQQRQPTQKQLAKECDDAGELYILRKKITDLSDEVDAYRDDREKLENYIEKLTLDYEDLKQENQDMSSKLDQKQLLLLQSQGETSESLVRINELESQVKGFEKELEIQAQGFESDLDAMMQAKIEQEQRAICAEEALRKTRLKNTLTAERLQEELRRLSAEMEGKLEENEKLMRTALTESEELRIEKKNLEEKLQKANEELGLTKDQNNIKWEEITTQLQLKTRHLEQMSSELDDVSKQLVDEKTHIKEREEASLKKIQLLKSQLASLMKEESDVRQEEKAKVLLSNQVKRMKASLEEKDTLLEKWNRERDELEKTLARTKAEADRFAEENSILNSARKDKEAMIEKLLTEVESLRSEHNGLKQRLLEGESEKETLHRQLLQSRNQLEKMKHGSISSDKKLKKDDHEVQEAKLTEPITGRKAIEKNPKVVPISRDQCNVDELMHEMALLRERNKSMELELKEMEERYSEISLKFAEVEGERQQLVMTVRNLKGKKN